MTRALRVEFEGAVYHITSRGNAGGEVFLTDIDRRRFLETLGETVARYRWICHAYCLMSNHYHLLLETPSANLSRGMQLLNGVYAESFNRLNKRTGHLFQGRFKAILVEKDAHLLELARYVVLNPVRAGMVRRAHEWPWSSHRATSGRVTVPRFLATEWLLEQFGSVHEQAIDAYRRFIQDGSDAHAWSDLRAGSLLGSDGFVERMRPLLAGIPSDPEIRRRERTAARPSLEDLFADVSSKEMRDDRIYRAIRQYHYRLREVGDYLGLHDSTVSVIAKQIAAEKSAEIQNQRYNPGWGN